MAKPTPWVDPVTITTRPFMPASREDISFAQFGSEIPIVKSWKFHSKHMGCIHRCRIDFWNVFAKTTATA
jgi:hypothetical protein